MERGTIFRQLLPSAEAMGYWQLSLGTQVHPINAEVSQSPGLLSR